MSSLAEPQIRGINHVLKIQKLKADKGLIVKPWSFSYERRAKRALFWEKKRKKTLELKCFGSI